MALKIPRCARCSGACKLKTLPSVFGEEGPLKFTLLEMPVFACVKNHQAPVHGDFMIWLIQEIRAREAQIVAGKEERMIFKKHLCGGCARSRSARQRICTTGCRRRWSESTTQLDSRIAADAAAGGISRFLLRCGRGRLFAFRYV